MKRLHLREKWWGQVTEVRRIHCRLEKSRWWEKGRLACSWVMQPTTEITGVKSEVIQLIRFGTGILDLASPNSEILHFLAMRVFLSWACSVKPSTGPFRLSHPLTPHLLQSCTQFTCLFMSLCKDSSTPSMSWCGSMASVVWVTI